MASLLALCIVSATSAEARIDVEIDLSTQIMHVRSGKATYAWPVSTARDGYATPRGRYRPTLLKRIHYSRKYHMSPMPHAIFFNGGYAIHGTYETRFLGRPASHGCIRLAPHHAARLFEMVEHEGAVITIIGVAPHSGYRRNAPGKSGRPAPSRHRLDPGSADAPAWTNSDDE
jgi:lipoprotein-anchoring transpeptidase ErfK/SrfK